MNDIVWGKASEGLALGLSSSVTNVARLYLKNAGNKALTVLSHVEAGERHYDWYTLRLEDAHGNSRTLRLIAARERSAAVPATLKPGESLEHAVDVLSWAAREVNGGKALSAGSYKVFGVYEVRTNEGRWHGRLEAGPVTLKVAPKTGAKD